MKAWESWLQAWHREIASALPTLTNELLPNLVELGVQSISALVQGIQENGDSLAAGALSIVGTLAEGIAELLPMVADTAASLAVSLADGLTESLPNIIPIAIETISTLVENLTENANTVIDAGIQIILALGEGLIAALPQLIETIPQIVINIANVINDNAPKLVDTALYLITRLATGLLAATPTILANIPKIIEAIVAAFMAFQWLNLGKQLIDGVANGVKKAGESMATAAKNAFSKFKSKITGSEVATELKSIGKYIIDGIVGGIKNSLSKIANIAGKIKDTLLSKLKGLFKIASPSKLMKEEVGAYIGEGIAVGIEESGQMAVDARGNCCEWHHRCVCRNGNGGCIRQENGAKGRGCAGKRTDQAERRLKGNAEAGGRTAGGRGTGRPQKAAGGEKCGAE